MASASEDFANFAQFEVDGRPVNKLKVDELKQQLISRGLEKTGLKKDLQERLCRALANEKVSIGSNDSEEAKPIVINDETSRQEVSSTTDIKEKPSSTTDVKESNGQDEKQSREENDKGKKDEEKSGKAELTEGKNKETEDLEDGEIIGQEEERKDAQKTPVPEKRRRISLQRDKSNNPPTPGTRKRKWSSNKQKSSVVITTDSLKELIPGVQLASTPALEAVMELDDDKEDEEEGKNEKQQEDKEQENEKNSNNKLDEKSPYKRRIVQVADSKTVMLGEATNEAEPDNEQNDVSIVEPTLPSNDTQTGAGSHDDNQSSGTPPSSATATPVKREVSPARNPPSSSIHVSNLVRPFTQKQLMQHLSQFGAVTDEGFWINKIKSHCYVTYPSVDEATNARQSLHGERWPTTSPRTLRVDFAVNDKMLEDTGGALGKKVEESTEEKKEELDDKKERSRSKEKSGRKHKEKKEEKKKDEPSPANLLDKLFRKTTALPSIYWLPLTNEQVVLREKEREERRKQRQLVLQQDKQNEDKPRDAARKPQEREKPRETQLPKGREMPRDQNRRPPPRDNRASSPPVRQRPERRASPVRRRSRSRSPPFRRAADRRR